MYEKILVPLDGSELAEKAIPYAKELSGRLGSKITLLYISELADFEDEYRHVHQFYIQQMAENIQEDITRKWGKNLTMELKVSPEIRVGKPADEIINFAEEEKIGLIAMSTHGRTGMGRWAIGSVAYKVVKAASQPVYLIRAKSEKPDIRKHDKLNKILVPLDGSENSEVVIPYVEELAFKLKAKVTFIQALAPDYGITSERQLKQFESNRALAKNYIDNMVARFNKKGITTTAIFKEAMLNPTQVADEIMRCADEIRADLVAMSTQGHSASERTSGEYAENLGSIVEKMVNSGNSPLLLVKPLTRKY
jgi:nucleotide-binding universal stress UspA family protein